MRVDKQKRELGLTLVDVIEEYKPHGYTPEHVLQTLMDLYVAGYVTYPRTDCPYIPKEMVEGISTILCAVDLLVPGSAKNLTVNPKARVFIENFRYAHHAIIPAWRNEQWKHPLKSMSEFAQDVYKFIALSYLEVICA